MGAVFKSDLPHIGGTRAYSPKLQFGPKQFKKRENGDVVDLHQKIYDF